MKNFEVMIFDMDKLSKEEWKRLWDLKAIHWIGKFEGRESFDEVVKELDRIQDEEAQRRWSESNIEKV